MQTQFYPVEDVPAEDWPAAHEGDNSRLTHAIATAAWVSLTRTLGTSGGEVLCRLQSPRMAGCSR